MTEGKSQLDLYRIDRVTALNEMAEKGVLENEKLSELYDLEKNSSNASAEQVSNLSESIIKHIIATQNIKPKSLHYHEKILKENDIQNYTLVLYEAKSTPQSPIIALLGERVEGRSDRGANISHILFVYDKENIFAFCSGAGWQVVSPFVDGLFGLQIMSRLIPENKEAINAVKLRGFAGTVAGQTTNYRKKARASEIIEFGQLFKDLSGHIEKEIAQSGLGIEISQKRKNIGADFKNSFKLRKRMTLVEFVSLLNKISELLKTEPFFSIEDWLGLSPLGRSKKDKALSKKLLAMGLHKIYLESLCEEEPKFEVFVSDPDLVLYTTSNYYRLNSKEGSFTYDEFHNETDLIKYVKEVLHIIEDGPDKEQKLIEFLTNTYLESHIEDDQVPLTSSPLVKCLQFYVSYEGKNYIHIDGQWYVIYEALGEKLNRELPSLIRARESMFTMPEWGSGLAEEKYLSLLSTHYSHAVLHRKRPLDNIELCDTMFIDGKRLVLCHVKDGFDTKMRVLAAQVRSSANLINDMKLSNRINELKVKWASFANVSNLPSWDIVEKAILGIDGYQVVQCIVFNPDIDFDSITSINSIIAKYELSSLIKKWEYEFPLEIALPQK